jgi:hypothetical protein
MRIGEGNRKILNSFGTFFGVRGSKEFYTPFRQILWFFRNCKLSKL